MLKTLHIYFHLLKKLCKVYLTIFAFNAADFLLVVILIIILANSVEKGRPEFLELT